MKTLLKASAVWFAILVLAVLNGTLREKVLVPAWGGFAGLLLSGVILSAGVFLAALLSAPWYGARSSRDWLLLGAFWLLLTLGFEFGFGRVVQHKTWQTLFEAYTFRDGNLWPLVLLMTLLAPWLAARLRGQVL